MKTVLTYGTFDLFHVGHLRLLERLKNLGDQLIVGVSTDEFNAIKGKQAVVSFEDRCKIIRSIRYVDMVFAENTWDQKIADISRYKVDVFGMGDDWLGHFDNLRNFCQVVYIPRTEGISSTILRHSLAQGPRPSTNLH